MARNNGSRGLQFGVRLFLIGGMEFQKVSADSKGVTLGSNSASTAYTDFVQVQLLYDNIILKWPEIMATEACNWGSGYSG